MIARAARALFVAPVAALALLSCGSADAPGPADGAPDARAELGQWSFRLDPGDSGLRRGWQRGVPNTEPVTVPHVARSGPVGGRDGQRVYKGSVAWYATTLRADRTGHYALRFGSANHDARVWVNGREICRHRGAYTPFGCPADLDEGLMHTVVARLDWRGPDRHQRAGYDRAWFNWGGLAWPVTVAPLGASTLNAPLVITRLRGGVAEVEVRVRVTNLAARARAVAPHGYLEHGGDRIELDFNTRRLEPNASAILSADAIVRRPQLWAPGRPRLHDLVVQVDGESSLRRRVGLRELRWGGGRLRLNGRPLRLTGASLPPDAEGRGDALTGEEQDRIVEQLRAVGANATRAQFPLSDEMLGRLDAAGIMVWQQIGPFDPAGAFSSRTPLLRERARRRALSTAARQGAHPSVVVWSLANEVGGQGHPAGQAGYIDSAAGGLHRQDPSRPVAVEVWGEHPPRTRGRLYRRLDVLGITSYAGWYELAGRPAPVQEARAVARVQALRRLYPRKPLVITEFGASADRRNRGARPGTEAYQARLIGRRIRTLAPLRGVAGMLVFCLRDYAYRPMFDGRPPPEVRPRPRFRLGLNPKGLFRYDGTPRPAVRAARDAWRRVSRFAPRAP
jgi:hypothetical protein